MNAFGEAPPKPYSGQRLSVRPAGPDDFASFLELSRLCIAESCQPFSEDQTRYVFAGIGRDDFGIHLLVAGAEPVGFSIVQSIKVPLTDVVCLREELLFVRKDLRSVATEGLLHALTITLFKGSQKHREISLYVGASAHALEVIEELHAVGFREAGLRMEAVHEEDGVPVQRTSRRLN